MAPLMAPASAPQIKSMMFDQPKEMLPAIAGSISFGWSNIIDFICGALAGAISGAIAGLVRSKD